MNIQLHTHTRHSIADALPTSLDYATAVGEGGALAMTDHDNMSGMIEHVLDCQKKKVKPILGVELTIRDADESKYHITLLAKNNTGLTNLFKMMASNRTFEEIAKYSDGVICLSGDLMSPVAVKFLREGKDAAIKQIERLSKIFKDFYLEIIDFGLEEQKQYNNFLLSVETMHKGIVYTSDAHFLNKEDCKNQMALLCERKHRGLTKLQIGYKWLENAYLKHIPTTQAMIDIVNMIDVRIEFGKYALPVYQTPEKFKNDQEAYLKHLVWRGLKQKDKNHDKEYIERARMELSVIAAMGFCGYFLIVWDFVDFCHNNGIIVGPGRGSGAGSMVAYCLRITDIDPIPYNLLFERFLNPDRISMPDFDIDFDNIGRPRAIEYVVQKYGMDKVCQIGTFSEIATRSAWKAAARVMGISVKESEKFSKLLPDNVGSKTFLKDLFDKDGKSIKNPDLDRPEFYETIKVAIGIEGTYKSVGKHAAGILILDRPVLDFIPAWPTQGLDSPFSKDKDTNEKDSKKKKKIANVKKKSEEEDLGVEMAYVSQISHKYAEKIGGIKFDFLGLKELRVVWFACKLIEDQGKVPPDVRNLDMEDKKTFELISSGNTVGMFQISSKGLSEFVKKLKPNKFGDIVAATSLYRPGPKDAGMHDVYADRKNGLVPVEYLHDLLIPVLETTYGVIVYQEQVMRITRDLAGYSLGGADLLRRAMGKKDVKEMEKQRSIFADGCKQKGVDEASALEIWSQIETFSRYGFNLSHAVAYSMITYQTAYLKAHFMAELLAAQMQVRSSDVEEVSEYIHDARKLGVKIVEANTDTSRYEFFVANGIITVGFCAIKGMNEAIARKIEKYRPQNVRDLVRAIPEITKRDFDALVKSGAADNMIRRSIANGQYVPPEQFRIDAMAQFSEFPKRCGNQISLFSLLGQQDHAIFIGQSAMLDTNVMLNYEFDVLERFVTDHPARIARNRKRLSNTAKIEDLLPDRTYILTMMMRGVKVIETKKGDEMAFLMFEDETGILDVTTFSDFYLENKSIIKERGVYVVWLKTQLYKDKMSATITHMEYA